MTKPAAKPAAKSTKKTEVNVTEDLERKAILESIETVDLPNTAPAGDTKYSLSERLINIDLISVPWSHEQVLKHQGARKSQLETKNV